MEEQNQEQIQKVNEKKTTIAVYEEDKNLLCEHMLYTERMKDKFKELVKFYVDYKKLVNNNLVNEEIEVKADLERKYGENTQNEE